MNLENIRIILARPKESRNIGSVCRAMANCGIQHLRIVGQRENFNETQIKTLALHATNIWEEAKFFENIKSAVADCVMSAATTRRRGKKRKGKLYLPEEFCEFAKKAGCGKIAIVFGNERTGLCDSEVDECSLAFTIPSSPLFPSLNLSHAVQIVAYHFFRAQNPNEKGFLPIDLLRLEKTIHTISENLEKIGFFKIAGKTDMEKFWHQILSRAVLSESEAQYIEKIFSKTAGFFQKEKFKKTLLCV